MPKDPRRVKRAKKAKGQTPYSRPYPKSKPQKAPKGPGIPGSPTSPKFPQAQPQAQSPALPASPPSQPLDISSLPSLLTLSPDLTSELWLARTSRKTQPEHWVLQVRRPGAERCTFYDLAGGIPPSTYSRSRTENKRFEHNLLPVRHKLAEIQSFEEAEVVSAALEVRADHCQRYVLGIIDRLEKKGIIEEGIAKGFEMDLQMNLFEGPNKPVREATFDAWVKRLGFDGALEKLMVFQGFM